MKFVVDTNVLGKLCHTGQPKNRPLLDWIISALTNGDHIFYVPAIVDYELRRKLLHLVAKKQAHQISIDRLNRLTEQMQFVEISKDIWLCAAQLWAKSKLRGATSGSEELIDADIIIAAHALALDAVVLTDNVKHFENFVKATDPKSLVN